MNGYKQTVLNLQITNCIFIVYYSVANKIKMGKKVEKSLKGEKNQSAISQDEEDPNKTPGNHSNQISP